MTDGNAVPTDAAVYALSRGSVYNRGSQPFLYHLPPRLYVFLSFSPTYNLHILVYIEHMYFKSVSLHLHERIR